MTAALLLVAGTAAATYPLPPAERTVEVRDHDEAFVVPVIDEKRNFGPYCVPRDVFCVGPFEPDIYYDPGTTGVRLETEDTYVTGGHDPGRKALYGPYAVTTLVLGDDLRICYEGCPIADPAYARAHGNTTLTLYLQGDVVFTWSYDLDERMDTLHPSQVPRSHCRFALETRC